MQRHSITKFASRLRPKSLLTLNLLEDRWTPAALSDNGSNQLTIALAADEDLFVISNGGNYRFNTNQSFTNAGVVENNDFSGFGGNQIFLNNLSRYQTIRIHDVGSNAEVNFNNSNGNSYTTNFEVELDNPNPGPVRFNSSSSFGAFNISVQSAGSIAVFNSVLSTTTGNILLESNRQSTATPAAFIGVEVTNSTVESTGTGTVTLRGRGGNSGTGFQYGVLLQNAGRVVGGTSGSTIIDGIGGANGGQGNYGVSLQGANTLITTNGSSLNVTGVGGGSSTGNGFNYGVNVFGGTITAGGNGAVTVNGTGGTNTSSSNHGVILSGDGSVITSGGGSVTVNGTGGGSGNSSVTNFGVFVFNGGQIVAGGNGSVTINATGGSTTGDSNDGIRLTGANSQVSSSGGNVKVVGIAGGTGSKGNNIGVQVASGAVISAGGNGLVMVTGTGSASSGDTNIGVLVQNANSRIVSNGGDLSVTGNSLGNGLNARSNLGVFVLSGGKIAAGGAAKTFISGQGGNGNAGFHHGVVVQGAGSIVTSGTGPVSILGKATSTGAGGSNIGVVVQTGGVVSAGGSGEVNVSGFGGSSTGSDNQGVFVDGANSMITSTNGNVTVTGQAGGTGPTSIGNIGILVYSGGRITAGPGGAVNVVGTGGNSDNQENIGVRIDGELGLDTRITSTDGPVTVTGFGGPGAGRFHIGVHLLFNGVVMPGGNGALTINGTGISAFGNTAGITVEKGGRVSSSGGPVNLIGKGSNGSQEGFNFGVIAQLDGQISAGGNASVTVVGTGGASTQSNNHGVFVHDTNSKITSSGGNVSVTGQGGGTGATSASNFGVFVFSSGVITASGNGTVTVIGTGGATGGSFNDGIRVAGAGSLITSGGGAVAAIGSGGGTGNSQGNNGVQVTTGGVLTAGGTATVTVNGSGGPTTGENNIGVFVFDTNSRITTSGGNLNVTGKGGNGNPQTNVGAFTANGGSIEATPPGKLTLDTTGGSPPIAKIGSSPNVGDLNSGQNQYQFTVVYSDNTGINVASIDSSDIRIVGPSGFNTLASLVSVSSTENGTPRTATYRITPPGGTWNFPDNGTYTITMLANQVFDTAGNAVAASTLGSFTVTLANTGGGTPSPVLVGVPRFAAGADRSGTPTVQFYNPDGSLITSLTVFESTFSGGVRTASADFNNDNVPDLVVGTGPGRSTRVRILSGTDFSEIFATDPFEASFTGGVYISTGDIDGDSIPDLAITPDEGGGPRVDVYSGKGFGKIASFFGIDDTNFRGGARSAIGDLSGDGVGDLIVVAGFGGGPRVAGFDGKLLSQGIQNRLFGDFFAFEQTLRNGIFVGVGDVNGDGFADLIAGGGPGGGPRVQIFSGSDLRNNQYSVLANFFGGDTNSRGGIRLAVKNLDNDNKADLVVGAGSGAGSRVTAYRGTDLSTGNINPVLNFDAISGFNGGIFVG